MPKCLAKLLVEDIRKNIKRKIDMAKFEGQDRREATLAKVLPEYGFKSLDEARDLCLSKGIDVDAIVKGIQLSLSITHLGHTH